MSGPIVRSGASPEFSKNWELIFGGAKPTAKNGRKTGGNNPSTGGKSKAAGKSPKKKAAKKKKSK